MAREDERWTCGHCAKSNAWMRSSCLDCGLPMRTVEREATEREPMQVVLPYVTEESWSQWVQDNAVLCVEDES